MLIISAILLLTIVHFSQTISFVNQTILQLIEPSNSIKPSEQTNNATIPKKLIHLSLFEAIRLDNTSKIEEALERGASVDIENDEGKSPLQVAVESCCINALDLLLRKGGDFTRRYYDCKETLLHLSLKKSCNCSSELLKTLLKFIDNIDAGDCNESAPLHLAAAKGDLNSTRILLENGADIEKKDNLYRSPLYISSENGTTEVLKYLVLRNANVNANAYRNWYPIHAAARYNHIEAMEILLYSGADIEQTSSWYTRRPIHRATCYNKKEAVQFLISKGANVNAQDLWERTSLFIAVENGLLDIVKILIEANANVNIPMRGQLTPLMCAAADGNIDFISLLLDNGAQIRARASDGRTVVHYVAKSGNVDALNFILKIYPEGLEIQDFRGRTPVFSAAFSGSLDLIEALVAHGANIKRSTNTHMTIIHAVAESGNLTTLKAVLKYDVDLNARDTDGISALFTAATFGSEEIFSHLLSLGADPHILTTRNETILHAVTVSGSVNITRIALSLTSNIDSRDYEGMSAMYRALTRGRHRIFEIIFNSGADPNIPSNAGETLLHLIAHHDDIDGFNKIFKRIRNIDSRDNKGRTPLYVAAERGKKRIFIILVNNGADINSVTYNGENLLHGASEGGRLDIVQYVLKILQKINAQDMNGRTALYISARKPSLTLFRFFQENGADLLIKTKENETILHAAASGGNVEIVNEILLHTDLLNARDVNGKSAIFYAAESSKWTTLYLLYKRRADTQPASDGWSLLHSAAKTIHLKILAFCLHLSKDINRRDKNGMTPLFISIESYVQDVRSIKFLLKKGADPNIPKEDGKTILHWAGQYGDVIVANMVLNVSTKSVNSQDLAGRSPLHLAVYYDHIPLVELLLHYHASIDMETIYGYTPLMIAAAKGSLNMMELFSSYDYSGEGLLGAALVWGNRQVVSYLIKNKVNITNRTKIHFTAAMGDNTELVTLIKSNYTTKEYKFNAIMREITKEYLNFTRTMEDDEIYIINPLNFKLSPLDMAVFFNGSIETVELLINMTNTNVSDLSKYRKRWTPMDMAAFSGKEDMVEYFINCGIPVDYIGEDSWTPIHKAAWGGHSRVVKILFDHNVDINKKDVMERTPLHIAAMRGFNVTVEQIIRLSNASINEKDRYYFTPLHLAEIFGHPRFFHDYSRISVTIDASEKFKMKDPGLIDSAYRNHTRTVELLLERGADPNMKDRVFGWTPLHWASAIGDLDVAKQLVAKGAMVNIPSKQEQTPMYLARWWVRKNLYSFLKSNNGVW